MNREGRQQQRYNRVRPTEAESIGSGGRSDARRNPVRTSARGRTGVFGMVLVAGVLASFAFYLGFSAFRRQVTDHDEYVE